jgi:ubiquinone/menaquinone biosynthesis C-methylase UbiE
VNATGKHGIDPSDAAYAGQELYSRAFLRIYDPVILGFYGNVVWRCPTSRLVQQYREHVGHRHLDVGPGTGYFLEHARLPHNTQITLLDPNPDVLAHAARRLSKRHPSAIQADVLKRLPLTSDGGFDSAALNYVLHCLPGPPTRKARAVQNVAAVLKPGGVLFGATVLGASGPHTWLSRAVLKFVNSRRVFDNLCDTEDALRDLLAESFATVEIEVIGSVALFTART